MEQKFIVSNILAWSLGMASLGAISLGSFQTGAILLGGLFFYDAFWVFGSDVMMTVATKVEAPVKFIFPAPDSEIVRDYNFRRVSSILRVSLLHTALTPSCELTRIIETIQCAGAG